MATYDYYKLKQGGIPAPRHGAQWWWIRIDFSKQHVVAADVLKLAEIKSGSIVKCGLTRVTSPTAAAMTIDLETSAGGNELDAAIAANSGTDTWLTCDTADDNNPITITADGYIYATINTAGAVSGIVDVLFEIVMAGNADIDRYADSLAEAN